VSSTNLSALTVPLGEVVAFDVIVARALVQAALPKSWLYVWTFVLDSSINKPLQVNATGSKSNRGKSALIAATRPLEFVTVAVFPVRVNVTRLSKLAVVKSNAIEGNTRSVAVSANDGVIIFSPAGNL
jgi:hypothetical protein